MKLNIIMVNYNTTDETIQTVNSIMENGWGSESTKIYVVDNNSDINEKIKLDKIRKYDNVIITCLESNIGYFPALNVGLDNVPLAEKEESLTIVCNNDLLFNKCFFEKLQTLNVSEDVYALSPSVKTINGIYQNPSMEKKPSKFRNLMYSIYYSNYIIGLIILKVWRSLGLGVDSNTIKDEVEKNIFIGIGAIYILLPAFFRKNKNLNYPLFLYGEEAFFSQQIHNSGGKIRYIPSLEVIHLESISTKKIPSKNNYLLNKKAFKIYRDYFNKY